MGHVPTRPQTILMNSRRSMVSPPPQVGAPKEYQIIDGGLLPASHLKGRTAHVRFGSKADIGLAPADVRSSPKSGHCRTTVQCPRFIRRGAHALSRRLNLHDSRLCTVRTTRIVKAFWYALLTSTESLDTPRLPILRIDIRSWRELRALPVERTSAFGAAAPAAWRCLSRPSRPQLSSVERG